MTRLGALFRRELSLGWGKGGGPLLALAFYAAVATLLPLAVGAEPQRLKTVATGSAWLALALASLLSLERLFERDYEDGALDLLALGAPGLETVCFIKCLTQWLANGAPLALAAPIAIIALGADPSLTPIIVITALLGGLGFAFTGGVGAALSIGSRRGGVLIADGLDWKTALSVLAAYSLAAVALGPFAMAAACRNALS